MSKGMGHKVTRGHNRVTCDRGQQGHKVTTTLKGCDRVTVTHNNKPVENKTARQKPSRAAVRDWQRPL